MHFKSGAEIKAAFNNFVKNANKIRNLNDLKNLDKLKGNLGKLRKFWADISKPLDVEANLKQIGKLKLFGPAPLRWLGKFSPWMATTDAVNSGISAITNFVKGNAAEGFRDAGHALMAGAVILSATGAGAPVAAGVAVLGAAFWVGGTIAKHWNTIRTFANNPQAVINKVKNTFTGAKDFVKSAAEKVSGAFDKVKGWFGR